MGIINVTDINSMRPYIATVPNAEEAMAWDDSDDSDDSDDYKAILLARLTSSVGPLVICEGLG